MFKNYWNHPITGASKVQTETVMKWKHVQRQWGSPQTKPVWSPPGEAHLLLWNTLPYKKSKCFHRLWTEEQMQRTWPQCPQWNHQHLNVKGLYSFKPVIWMEYQDVTWLYHSHLHIRNMGVCSGKWSVTHRTLHTMFHNSQVCWFFSG